MSERVRAWYFLPTDRKLANGDGREIRAGRTLKVAGPVELCKRGLHASENPLDALRYASTSLVSRVVLSGTVLRGDDKLAATERKTLWILDCEEILHEFACRVAVRALKKAKVTDERAWNAIRVKRLWIAKKASDSELDAARDAARDAALAAARDAAWAAARDAALAAARDAAWAAALAAAWDAEQKWQNRLLTRMLLKARKKQLAEAA